MIELLHANFEDLHTVGRVDLVIADPPDNLGLGYDGYPDKLDTQEYEARLRKWVTLCCEHTKGPVFFTFNERWTRVVEQAINDNSIPLIQRLYWRWTFGVNQQKRYVPSIRPIYWLNSGTIYPAAIRVPSDRQLKYKDKRAKAGGKMPDNVWDFPRVCGTFKERRRWHVCQLPEALVERIVLGHSQPGDRVLDPFIGSGTTAYVCQKHGRDCLGVDQSSYYLGKIAQELDHRSAAPIGFSGSGTEAQNFERPG